MDWLWIGLTILGCLLLVHGAPQGTEPIKIVSQTSNLNPDGSYEWSFETANSIKAEEKGTLKKSSNPDYPDDAIEAQGSVSYTDKEGNQISLTYIANDEVGFVPQGAHLPTPPPIPPEIQKALEYIAAHPSPESKEGRRRRRK